MLLKVKATEITSTTKFHELASPVETQQVSFSLHGGGSKLSASYMCKTKDVGKVLKQLCTQYTFTEVPQSEAFDKFDLALTTMNVSTPIYRQLGKEGKHPLVVSTSVTISPFTGDKVEPTNVSAGRNLEYDHMIVTVTYDLVPRADKAETKFTSSRLTSNPSLILKVDGAGYKEKFEGAHEYRLLKKDHLKDTLYWSDGTEVQAGGMLGVLTNMVTWTYTIFGMPKIPNQYTTLLGKVNNSVMRIRKTDTSFPIGAVLYNDLAIKEWTNWNDQQLYDLELEFLCHQGPEAEARTWNKFVRNRNSLPDYIQMKHPTTDVLERVRPYERAAIGELIYTSITDDTTDTTRNTWT